MAWKRLATNVDKKKRRKHMFILHDVPRGKSNYRRQFGKAICQKAMVEVVEGVVREGVVREGVVVDLQNSRVGYVCDCEYFLLWLG